MVTLSPSTSEKVTVVGLTRVAGAMRSSRRSMVWFCFTHPACRTPRHRGIRPPPVPRGAEALRLATSNAVCLPGARRLQHEVHVRRWNREIRERLLEFLLLVGVRRQRCFLEGGEQVIPDVIE